MRNNLRPKYLLPICWLLLLIAGSIGCGGGSEGTGIGGLRSISGIVEDQTQRPLEGVSVTLVQTGDTQITDQTGHFNFLVDQNDTTAEYQLEVASATVEGTVTVPNNDPEVTQVEMRVVVNTLNGSIAVSDVQVWARIVGDCERYFDNKAVIRQTKATPALLQCTLRFFASAAGQRVERIPGQIQVRACSDNLWRPIANGKTGAGVNAGVGEIEFDFLDDRRNCEYRLAAPHDSAPLMETYIYIKTLTLLNRR